MLIVIISTLFISLIGLLIDYLFNHKHKHYDSPWRQIKIALSSYYLWSIGYFILNGNKANYWLSLLIGCISIILIISGLFYLLIKIVNKINRRMVLIIFFITIFISQLFIYRIINFEACDESVKYTAMIAYGTIFGVYLLGLIIPQKTNILIDPVIHK